MVGDRVGVRSAAVYINKMRDYQLLFFAAIRLASTGDDGYLSLVGEKGFSWC
jgi:hypothetical protein